MLELIRQNILQNREKTDTVSRLSITSDNFCGVTPD